MFAMTFRYAAAGGLALAFASNKKKTYQLIASSILVSAASFPIAWFAMTRPLVAFFGIRSVS
jgi:ABC-type uncharacterized transport system permease subunit